MKLNNFLKKSPNYLIINNKKYFTLNVKTTIFDSTFTLNLTPTQNENFKKIIKNRLLKKCMMN